MKCIVRDSVGTKAVTDKDKLEAYFDAFEVECAVGEKTIKAAGRRFHFNKQGELMKVQEGVRGGWVTSPM
jgi:hypothetical protein